MKKTRIVAISLVLCLSFYNSIAQTDADALFMAKGDLCTGPMYSYNAWKNYWEGTTKRDNLNLGTVSMQSVSLMGMYGIKKNAAIFYNVPYVMTNASAGQWQGQQGFQDLSLWLKYKPFTWNAGDGKLSLIGLLGVSTPMSDYSKDMLPFSIGMGSTNLSSRIMVDYILHGWFATASATYVWRSNVELDRTAYYTDQMHYTNEVDMPNATQWNIRLGYRTNTLVAEAVIDNWTTQGGYDITPNNMPFISNEMNATRVGVNFKKEEVLLKPLTVFAGGNYVVAGRNMGQSFTAYGGLAWIFHFARKAKPAEHK